MTRSIRSMSGVVMVAAVASITGCGVVEDTLGRVQAWWDDGGEEAATEESVPTPEPSPDVPPDLGGVGASTSGAGSSGPGPATGSAGDSGGPGGAGTGGTGSTSVPMSFAAAPTTSGTGDGTSGGPGDDGGRGDEGSTSGTDSGGTSVGDTAGSTGVAPTVASPSCLDGEWVLDDDSAYYRAQVRKQAHGRAVRRLSRSGSASVRFDRGRIDIVATHRRLVFAAVLADNEIRYTVDVHGELEAPIRAEGSDVLVIETPRIDTLRAREVAKFPGGKAKRRRLDPPSEGRYEYSCGGGTLELARLEDGKAGPSIRLARPTK